MTFSPNLSLIRSFEAAARNQSFTAAAEELGYTQAAISNHVRSLEEFIGRPLFIRHPRSLELNELGMAYYPTVQLALQQIDAATESIAAARHAKKLSISCPVSLAENWLAPRIAQFSKLNPDLEFTVHGNIWLEREPLMADICFRFQRNEEISEGALFLWQDKLAVVCAPTYEVNGVPIASASDLETAHLIHILGRSNYWPLVATHLGLPKLGFAGGSQTNSLNVAMELAGHGLGCAVVPRSLIQTHLNRGLLKEPLALDIDSPWGCYVTNTSKLSRKLADRFLDWLAQQL